MAAVFVDFVDNGMTTKAIFVLDRGLAVQYGREYRDMCFLSKRVYTFYVCYHVRATVRGILGIKGADRFPIMSVRLWTWQDPMIQKLRT